MNTTLVGFDFNGLAGYLVAGATLVYQTALHFIQAWVSYSFVIQSSRESYPHLACKYATTRLIVVECAPFNLVDPGAGVSRQPCGALP